jgi:hypothetical protein
MIFCESIAAPSAGRHGDGARAQGFAASNIARGIANHIDLRGGELATMLFFRACAGERSEPISVSMIIGEGPKFEKVPDPVMLEL